MKKIRPRLYLVLSVIVCLYVGLNYYVGLRIWQTFFAQVRVLPGAVYWLVFWFIALAYLSSRVGEGGLPHGVSRALNILGSYWLGVLFYALLVFAGADLTRGLNRLLHFLPLALTRSPLPECLIFFIIAGLVLYGAWNARHPVVNHYDLSMNKRAGHLEELHIVMASDLHLGTLMDNRRLAEMVDKVNALEPDLILLAGDVIDENVERVVRQEMRQNLSRLQAPYGVYAVLGNHEYIGRQVEEAVSYLGASGISVLRDSCAKIADSFYLCGRDDRSGRRFTGHPRGSLRVILAECDPSLPWIVMDHEPSHLEEAEEAKVDLQLSGHTHRGQLFPIQFLTRRIFANDFGLLRRGDFQLIVSSGFGTWGPPLRLGSRPEIVDIKIRFLH